MVILFDGVCNLCNWWVRFILKHDKDAVFKFASLQSKYGIQLQAHFNLSPVPLQTVLLYDGEKIYGRSEAVIRISRQLHGIYKSATVFRFLPRVVCDFFYNIIAKSRYSIFGKKEQCMVPEENIKNRFLDNTEFIPSQQV